MSKQTDAYNRGLAQGKAARANLKKWMESLTSWARQSYPASRHLDYWKEVVQLDEERMTSPPNVSRFPETKDLPDLLVAERKGFLDGSGGGPEELAFHYTWSFFGSRRLNTRYIGTGIRANHCSEIYIRQSKEGGPLFGRNIDDVRRPAFENFQPPKKGPDGKRRKYLWTDSGAVLCDEEPKKMFPVNVLEIMPNDCKRTIDRIEFLRRYVEFWGPNTSILVDEEQNVAVIES